MAPEEAVNLIGTYPDHGVSNEATTEPPGSADKMCAGCTRPAAASARGKLPAEGRSDEQRVCSRTA